LIDFEKLDLNLSFYLTINYLQMEEEDAFVKYEYQIHIKDCANRVIHKLKCSTLSPKMKISVDEYQDRLKLAVSCYYESVQLSKNLTETEKNRKQLIPTDHPAFDFWLSLHLTTVEPYDIPLILDAYQRGQFGEIHNFIGHVEFFVKRIIKNNIFYPYDLHMKEIVNWIREIRRAENKAIPVNQTINIGELNFQINIQNNDNSINVIIDQRSIINNFNPKNIFYAQSNHSPDEKIKNTNSAFTKTKSPNISEENEYILLGNQIKLLDELEQELTKLFTPYLYDKEDSDKLKLVFSGNILKKENMIKMNITANQMADVFRRLSVERIFITSYKVQIANWLVSNFQFFKPKQKRFEPSTIIYFQNLLSGKNSPSENNKIDVSQILKALKSVK
jgi:hypothetical protein